MASDRMLRTLLLSLRLQSGQYTESQLTGTAAGLLTTLINPLNISLLTSHLLAAPAIWNQPNGTRTCLQFMQIFQSAAYKRLKATEDRETAKAEGKPYNPPEPTNIGQLSREEWVKAVLSGAGQETPSWRHMLVASGLIVGFESYDRQGMSASLRQTVEAALVKATNVAVDEAWDPHHLSSDSIAMSLNYSFSLLSDIERSHLDFDRLLPILTRATLFSREGLASVRFLENIDHDVLLLPNGQLSWPKESRSFASLTQTSTRPIATSLGSMARLIAYVVEHVSEPWLVQSMLDDLEKFATQMYAQWSAVRLSDVSLEEQARFYDTSTLTVTVHTLFKTLTSALFTTTIVLHSVLSRTLHDRGLANDDTATDLAAQVLRILRRMYFVSSRMGHQSFSQYDFVYLTAIDILAAYPPNVDAFLNSIGPATLGSIPPTALDRNLDLFFLNTAEHLAIAASPQTHDSLLIAAAIPYIVAGGDPQLIEIFEAAHCVILAILSSTKSDDVAYKYIPFYVDALFRVFPQSISARQFRLAFKTLLRICSPPSTLSSMHPMLTETLLELLHHRAWNGPPEVRPLPYTAPEPAIPRSTLDSPSAPVETAAGDKLDEQTAVTMTLLDCLPLLPVPILENWLPLSAELIWRLPSEQARHQCQDRFWEALVSGEMDVERSRVCATWWGTKGGRQAVLGEEEEAEPEYLMSGALRPEKSKL